MGDRIGLTIANGIADVRLNRPDRLNALDPAMFKAIAAVGSCLRDDRSIRVVILSGEGAAFCAGLDMDRLVATTEGESILPFADLGIAGFRLHFALPLQSQILSGCCRRSCIRARLRRAAPSLCSRILHHSSNGGLEGVTWLS